MDKSSFRIGLCSVTLRDLTAESVISVAVESGCEAIEWGGDVHVRPDDFDRADAVGNLTRRAGLALSSFGSYYGLHPDAPKASASDVVATARALGAPRVRVWAGDAGSAETDRSARRAVVSSLQRFARHAADEGISTALEFHAGTLTDSAASALRLLEEVDEPSLTLYWQPRVGATTAEALADLDALGGHVSTYHVFSWDPKGARLRLDAREDLWKQAVSRASSSTEVTDLLIEFVPGDSSSALKDAIASLRAWRTVASPRAEAPA